jgi:universal stress protein E
MLTSVLVASDLSSRSGPAIERAVALAKTHGASLSVLHVLEADLLDASAHDAMLRAEASLQDQLSRLAAPARTEIVVTAGHAFHVIDEEARARNADLILMGAHRRQFLKDVFIGTTVERVTRTAGRPVLMVNAAPAGMWRRVFIATDMSETSAHAARRARDLGFLDKAEVTFVHGHAPIMRHMLAHAGVAPDKVQLEAEREFQSTRKDLAQFMQGLGFADMAYHARIIEGVGADAIAGLVERDKPDLLVIGTRGLSGVRRMFLGSVAQDLMSSLTIDILAVPPQG